MTIDPMPTPPATAGPDAALAVWRARALELERVIGRVVVGQSRAIRLLTIAVLTRGDVLLEGNVGVGKTVLLRSFARVIGGAYERIEGTVDQSTQIFLTEEQEQQGYVLLCQARPRSDAVLMMCTDDEIDPL